MTPLVEAQNGGDSATLPNDHTAGHTAEQGATKSPLPDLPEIQTDVEHLTSEPSAISVPSPKKSPADPPADPPADQPQRVEEEDATTKVLHFLSTATPETFGAIGLGLAFLIYLILGQIGLLLIGLFAGIILYASWESRQAVVSGAVRGKRGAKLLQQLLATKSTSLAGGSGQDVENEAVALARSFDDFAPETREALNELVDAVIHDYVDWWYGPIVPSDQSFPLSCRKVLISFILSVSNQLGRKRPADSFIDFLTHSCSIIIVFLAQMATAYSSATSTPEPSAADVIYNYLSSDTESPLSNLLNQRQQAEKFKMVADDLLCFLDKSARDCDPVKVFLREIISSIVLEGTLQTCSRAEWINGWIVYLLESGETDLSQAIDEAIETQKAFGDIDGNVGNIALSKGNRNSYEMDKARRKEQNHKKKLSKADEEMERAVEEMKRLNEMIAEADKEKEESIRKSSSEASGRPDASPETNAKGLGLGIQQPNGDPAGNHIGSSSEEKLSERNQGGTAAIAYQT